MPIGTSDGEQFPDEMAYLAANYPEPVNYRNAGVNEQFSPEGYDVPGVGYVPTRTKVPEVLGEMVKATGELLKAPGEAYKGNLTPDQITEKGVELAFSIAGTSYPFANFKPGVGLFGGRYSTAAAKTAAQMEKAGISEVAIKEFTGLERGAEGAWRREFSDKEAVFMPKGFAPTHSGSLEFARLGEILKHEKLYQAYPEAADIPVMRTAELKNVHGGQANAAFDRETGLLMMSKKIPLDQIKASILHEVQHWIQREEGFAHGGAVLNQIPADLKKQYLSALKEKYPNHPFDPEYHMYRSIAGEQEAFNVMRRSNMSEKEIRSSLGKSTETVPREHQIISNSRR